MWRTSLKMDKSKGMSSSEEGLMRSYEIPDGPGAFWLGSLEIVSEISS